MTRPLDPIADAALDHPRMAVAILAAALAAALALGAASLAATVRAAASVAVQDRLIAGATPDQRDAMLGIARNSAIIGQSKCPSRDGNPQGLTRHWRCQVPAKYTPEQFVVAFWAKVDKSAGPDSCWPWIGARHEEGYGLVWRDGRKAKAHRVAHELTNGPLPPDKPCVLHKCDNPPCCNPRCLFAGTNADNVADKVAKGRQARVTGDRHGSRTCPESRPRGDRNPSRMYPERLARGERHGARTHPESVLRGERVASAKLTEADIPIIRAAAARRERHVDIAHRFGVSKSLVGQIARGEIWKHVKGIAGGES